MTTQELATRNGTTAMEFTPKQIELIKETVAKGATDLELEMFLARCQKTGLDPLANQIHFIKRKDKATIQTGIDGFRLVADRTGLYAGNDEPSYEDGQTKLQSGKAVPDIARVTVWKIVGGQRCPFTSSARWSEYFPGDNGQGFMWMKMPYLMLGKCAEALALRKAFPQELSGMYEHAEMDQAEPQWTPIQNNAPALKSSVDAAQTLPDAPALVYAGDKLLERWSELRNIAVGLGIQVESISLPIIKAALIEKAKSLKAEIEAKEAEIREKELQEN